jgi:hypothetical protein
MERSVVEPLMHGTEVRDLHVRLQARRAAVLRARRRLDVRPGVREAAERQAAGALDVGESERRVMPGIDRPGQALQVVPLIHDRVIGHQRRRGLTAAAL